MLTDTNTKPVTLAVSDSNRLITVVLAAALGSMLLFSVGFAQPLVMHNAAHDARHAAAFPCH